MKEELDGSDPGRQALKRIVEASHRERSLILQRESTLKVGIGGIRT